jgi:O-antigen/teichoic acid export membrane protein
LRGRDRTGITLCFAPGATSTEGATSESVRAPECPAEPGIAESAADQSQRSVISNVVWLACERMIRLVSTVVIYGLIGRILAPVAFGELMFSLTCVGIVAQICTLGLEGLVIKELILEPNDHYEVLGTAFLLRFSALSLCSLGIAFLGPTLGPPSIPWMLLTICSLSILPQALNVVDLWFQRWTRSRYTVLAKLTSLASSSLLHVALIFRHASVRWFAGAIVADSMILAGALAYLYKKQGFSVAAWTFDKSRARLLLKSSWPLITSAALVGVALRLDVLLVMSSLGSRSTGIYSAASRAAEVWGTVINIVMVSLFPVLTNLWQTDMSRAARAFGPVLETAAVAGIGLAIVVTLAAPFVLPLVYGPEYSQSARILMILAWTAPFVFSASVRAQYLLLTGDTRYHNWAALAGIATTCILNPLFIRLIGLDGAALASVIAYLISGVLTSFLFPTLRPFGRMQCDSMCVVLRPKRILSVGCRLISLLRSQPAAVGSPPV